MEDEFAQNVPFQKLNPILSHLVSRGPTVQQESLSPQERFPLELPIIYLSTAPTMLHVGVWVGAWVSGPDELRIPVFSSIKTHNLVNPRLSLRQLPLRAARQTMLCILYNTLISINKAHFYFEKSGLPLHL